MHSTRHVLQLASCAVKGALAAVIGVLLLAGGLAVALDRRPVDVRTVPVDEIDLRPGQTEVTGTVAFLRAEPASGPPLPLPLTVSIPQRGVGGATISNALVGNKRVAIVWEGGQPMPLQGKGGAGGGGSLDIAPAPVEVTAAGVRWFLDGSPKSFAPGAYAVRTSVAVGASGLATPRSGADFTADDTTAMSTHGNASVVLPLAAMVLEGPGGVRMEGRLRVRTSDGVVEADRAEFGAAPYRVELTPGPSGIAVKALFDGPRAG